LIFACDESVKQIRKCLLEHIRSYSHQPTKRQKQTASERMNMPYSRYVAFVAMALSLSCSPALSTEIPADAVASSYFYDGVRIHFRDRGAGNPIVFIHGFGASLDTWRHLEDGLENQYRIISLDLKGHGYSERPLDDRYSLQDHAAVVLGLMDHLKLENAVLIGNSLGCAIALMAALKAQQESSTAVAAMVLIAGSLDGNNLPFYLRLLRLPMIGSIAAKLTPASFGTRLILKRAYYDDEKVTDSLVELYAKYQRIPGTEHALITTARQMIPADISGLREALKKLEIPTLNIIGKHDQIISQESAATVCQIVSRCRAVVVDEVGHVPHEEKPEKVLSLLNEFLPEVLGDRTPRL
jgi:pimeloyl-ACP methyl ester carboxylesterase